MLITYHINVLISKYSFLVNDKDMIVIDGYCMSLNLSIMLSN